MNRHVISDPTTCVGCKACEIACVKAHMGEPIEGLTRKDFTPRIAVIAADGIKAAFCCRHCEDMPCGKVCPSGAITQAEDSIQVLQKKCIGCGKCVYACPYGAMNVRLAKLVRIVDGTPVGFIYKAQAQKCDLCIESPTGSACVAKCPKNSLKIVYSDGTPYEVKN